MVIFTEQFEQARRSRDRGALRVLFNEMPHIETMCQQTHLTPTRLMPWATLADHIPSIQACLARPGIQITPEVELNAHESCEFEAYRLLVPAGLEVNRSFGYAGTALTEAIMSHDRDFIQFLLDSGANPNAGSLNGSTTLETAIKESLPTEVLQLLIDQGAEFPTKGLICLAALQGDASTVEFLIRKGVDANEDTDESFVTAFRGRKMTPLHLAVQERHLDVVMTLLRFEDCGGDDGHVTLDRKAKDVEGKTLFGVCCYGIGSRGRGLAKAAPNMIVSQLLSISNSS